MYTNPNCNAVQAGTKITYNTIFLWTNTNRTNNGNVPRKNSQKHSDTKVEDYQFYKVELVEKCQNIGFLENITGQFLFRNWIPFM